jgi:cyanophycinase
VTGTIALLGGGEFTPTCTVDRVLLDAAGTDRVLLLPTGAAYEHPDRLVASAASWFDGLGAHVEGLAVLARPDASRPEYVEAVRTSRFTYLAGGSPMHLRSVLKETPLWEALVEAVSDGGVVAGSSAGAMVLTDPMVDPRGGAFTLGLGLVSGLAVIPAADTWSRERLHRTLELARGFLVAALQQGAALLHDGDGAWSAIGEVVLHDGTAEVPLDRLPVRTRRSSPS